MPSEQRMLNTSLIKAAQDDYSTSAARIQTTLRTLASCLTKSSTGQA